MDLVRSTPPAETPVSVDEAKVQLGVSHDDHNGRITRAINAATQLLDGRHGTLGRALVTQNWKLTLCGFPACEYLDLPLPPLQSVVAIKYYDGDNVQQTLSASAYTVRPGEFEAGVWLKYNESWPTTYERRDAVEVEFCAGFGTAAQVPEPIREAILMHVADLYANVGDAPVDPNVSKARAALIAPYRMLGVS